MATPQNFYNQDIPYSISWAESFSTGNPLQALIDKLAPSGTATKPAVGWIDKAVDFPAAATIHVPKEVQLKQVHGGKINSTNASDKLVLHGLGVEKETIEGKTPLFINFPVNNFEDTVRKGVYFDNDSGNAPLPAAISNELFSFTGADADSFDKRVKAADEAFRGYPVTVICHPGRKTKSYMVTQTADRTFHLLKGDYENDISPQYESADETNKIEYGAPFITSGNTYFTAEDGVRWFQSSVDTGETGIPFVYPRWYADDANTITGLISVKGGLEIHRGTVRNRRGTRAIFASGSMKLLMDGVKFFGTVGYIVTIMSVRTVDVVSEYSHIQNCYAEDCWDGFCYHWNVLHGRHSTFTECHSVFKDAPTGWNIGFPLTSFSIAFADLEPNANTDFIEDVNYKDCSVQFAETMPSGYIYTSTGFYLQSPWQNMKDVTIDGFKVKGNPTQNGSGIRHFIQGYGVDGLTVRNCEHRRDDHSGNYPIDLRNSRNLDFDGNKFSYVSRLAIFRNCQNTTWGNNPVKSFQPLSGLDAAPTIREEEVFIPVHLLGANIYSDRPFGNLQFGGVGLGHNNRMQELFVGLDFSINNVRAKVSSFNYPANIASYVYRLGLNTDFGSTTAKTFTNSNISGNQITISGGHGFFDGQAVLLESDATPPTVGSTSGWAHDASGRVFVHFISPTVLELANSAEDAVAGTTGTLSNGTAATNHRLRPFKASFVFAASVDTGTDTITSNVAHNFADKALVEYSYFGTSAAAIGGLLQNNDVIPDTANRHLGVYEIAYISPTEFKLKEAYGANKGQIVNLTSAGVAYQMFHLAVKSLAADTAPSTYEIEKGTLVELEETGRSRAVVPSNFLTDAIGSLPMVETTTIFPADDGATALAKLIKANEEANPPTWYANRFIDFDPQSLVATIANGANVASFTDGINDTLTYSQATSGIQGQLYHAGANDLPFLRANIDRGYEISGDFPNTANPKVVAIVGRSHPDVNSGHFTTTLNNNFDSGTLSHNAAWLLSLSYGDTLRHYNSGVVYSGAADRTNLQVIVIRINATNTKIWKNDTVLATDAVNKTIPAKLNMGHPYGASSVGAGTDYYRYTAWDADLSDEIIEAYIAYMMARYSIS